MHLSACMLLTYIKVMLLEVDLAGENAKMDPIHGVKTATARKKLSKLKLKVLEEIEAAGAFLKQYETAKIVVSIDTHCLEENGLLVWSEANKNSVGVCTLQRVGIMLVWWWDECDNEFANDIIDPSRLYPTHCVPVLVKPHQHA